MKSIIRLTAASLFVTLLTISFTTKAEAASYYCSAYTNSYNYYKARVKSLSDSFNYHSSRIASLNAQIARDVDEAKNILAAYARGSAVQREIEAIRGQIASLVARNAYLVRRLPLVPVQMIDGITSEILRNEGMIAYKQQRVRDLKSSMERALPWWAFGPRIRLGVLAVSVFVKKVAKGVHVAVQQSLVRPLSTAAYYANRYSIILDSLGCRAGSNPPQLK